jgi:glycosyltransferase involved in cell wall biosynthesis
LLSPAASKLAGERDLLSRTPKSFATIAFGKEAASTMAGPLRVALVHDWLTGMRGGEKVLEVFGELFPEAPLYTLVHKPGSVSPIIENREIVTSTLQRIPGGLENYRKYLPVLPMFVEQLRPKNVDLVLSSSSCVAKSVRAPFGAKHFCYVHSPMRYIYDRFDDYFAPGRAGLATRAAMNVLRRPMQRWDRATADRVDRFAANSAFVQERVFRCFGRESDVIPPPVDVARFAAAQREPEEYYLIVAALVPYKMVDVAVEAFRGLDRKLVVAGKGPMLDELLATAPPNVEMLGWVDDDHALDLVAGCRAFLMPNVEDFGIAPVEAMAAGRPVIALGEGGVLDSVRDLDRTDAGVFGPNASPTGVFYSDPTPQGLANAVRRFEINEHRFIASETSAWTQQFERSAFATRIRGWIEESVERGAERVRAA